MNDRIKIQICLENVTKTTPLIGLILAFALFILSTA